MIERLGDYRDRWKDQEVIIVGSGPTVVDHKDLSNIQQPLICINDSVYVVPHPDRYFYSLHPGRYRSAEHIAHWLKWVGSPYHPSRCVEIDFVWHDTPREPWQLDADFCEQHNRLAVRHGSLGGVLHFAWFCGSRKILGIGINPSTAGMGYDPRLQNHMPAEGRLHMQFLCKNQIEDLEFFGLQARYL